MTGRRTVKVTANMAELGTLLGLHETQHVVHAYVTDDPHRLVLVVEGGDELPELGYLNAPLHSWREYGIESPYVRFSEIPQPD